MLLSDGTGNGAAKLFKTNVWRLFGALDLRDPSRQVAHYSDGVGTSSFKPMAVLGGAFGFGLKRNVLDLYHFACRSYRPGDRIFGFGFSRGAFTIRIVAGLIATQGLVPYHGDEARLARDALIAYRAYRARYNVTGGLVTPLRHLRDWVVAGWHRFRGFPPFKPVQVETIHFIGVWDTVAAYGGPIEEITRGIDYWLWPLSMPDRLMSAKVQRACHALALDDERNSFWPVLWDENEVSLRGQRQPMMQGWDPPAGPTVLPIDRQRLSQVWFAGMHSCIGGGYPQDGLSYLTLAWMMDRAEVYGLLFNPVERARLVAMADGFDKLNDSRHGLSGYYRYKPRKLIDIYRLDSSKATISGDLARVGQTMTRRVQAGRSTSTASPLIHESVFQRIAAGLDGYSPIVLPEIYRVTTQAGDVQGGVYEHPTQATARAHGQEHAWNWAWLRRVVYFCTVFASLFLTALPVILLRWPGPGQTSPAAPLIPIIDVLSGFLPAMAAPWLDAFRAAPGLFAIGATLVSLLLFWGGVLQRRIGDVMLAIWRPILGQGPHAVGPTPAPRDLLYRLRTAVVYRGFFYALTHWILPTMFAAFIVYVTVVGANRILFIAADSLGLVCRTPSRGEQFETRSLCHDVGGPAVTQGRTYRITLETELPWRDDARGRRPIETGPDGFGSSSGTGMMRMGVPFRRHLSENWLALIVRVGANGRDEQALRFEGPGLGCAHSKGETVCTGAFTARSTGKVFIFVNDAVLAIPRFAGLFYANNDGRAKVRITPDP